MIAVILGLYLVVAILFVLAMGVRNLRPPPPPAPARPGAPIGGYALPRLEETNHGYGAPVAWEVGPPMRNVQQAQIAGRPWFVAEDGSVDYTRPGYIAPDRDDRRE